MICECCQTYTHTHTQRATEEDRVEGKKKSFTDSASGPFIIDPLKLLFAIMLNLRAGRFWNWVCCVKNDGVFVVCREREIDKYPAASPCIQDYKKKKINKYK